jgi:gliding motility-associated-like protein
MYKSKNYPDIAVKIKIRFTLFIICFCLKLSGAMAQNMVPNPSFELLKSSAPCWTSGSREDFQDRVQDWILPNMGTTDLLSTLVPVNCLTAMPVSTAAPVNYFPRGSQMPRTGNNFAGIKPLNDSRREYLEVKLACKLVPGEEYYAEMYVSLSENTNYAQNSLGMYFSDTLVYTNSFNMLDFTPQIVENNVIKDTVNWVKISGTFVATSPAEYLIIGSFATQANTILEFLGNKGEIDFPYYFIDDVKVVPVSLPSVSISGDTVVCKGDTIQLSASGWNAVSWTLPSAQAVISNNNQLIFIPSGSGIVTAKSNHCNLNLSRNVSIIIAPDPVINLGKDTLICPGTSVTLDAGPGLQNYEWSNGMLSQMITVSLPGIYSVTAENDEGCKGRDEIKINYYKSPDVNLGEDLYTCRPEGVLDAYSGQKYDVYEWQDNSTSPQLSYTSQGLYWVKVTNICGGEDVDTILVAVIDPYIPNLITSNNDGKNDRFEIQDIQKGKGRLWIYNRYGEPVYQSENYMNDFSGEHLTEGVYYFLFTYPTCPDVKGWLQIIR